MANFTWLRLKLMFGKKSFWLVYSIIALIVMLLISSLFKQVDKGLLIPVGLVDLDNSRFSKYIVAEIEKNPLLDVKTINNLEEVEDLVIEQELEAVYTIKKGAQRKVVKGDLDQLIDVVYLDGNSFGVMLTDIVSGDFLDEICLIIAGRYYQDAYKEYIDNNGQIDVYNKVYELGQEGDLKERSNYYLNLHIDSEEINDLTWYNQSIVLEKMIVGIVYVFIAFFVLFEGLGVLYDRTSPVYAKIKLSGMNKLKRNLVESFTLFLAGLLMCLPLVLLVRVYRSDWQSFLYTSFLFSLAISQLVYILIHIINKSSSYIMLGTSAMIGLGIISGSFFSIDLSNLYVAFIAKLFPFFYGVNTYFDKELIKEYSIYTVIYSGGLFLLCLLIDLRREKSQWIT